MEQSLNYNMKLPNVGYYIYDNQFFLSKFDAYDRAKELHDPMPYVRFYFNDNVYSKIDWTINPPFSLEQLYTLHAKKIREKYDYLILMYSGGSDSNQILHTFIKNNIFIDEIRSYYPIKFANAITPTYNPYDPMGLLSEYHAAIPLYDFIKKKCPNTKLNVIDYSDDIVSYIDDKYIVEYEKKIRHLGEIYQQFKHIFQTKDLKTYTDKLPHNKIGVIYGSDKPNILFLNNRMFFSFVDVGRAATEIEQQEFTNYTSELFFWNVDTPLISVKQCHIIKDYLKTNKELTNIVVKNPQAFKESMILKQLIYPDYDSSIYQKKGKPSGGDIIIDYFFKNKNIFRFIEDKNKYIFSKYPEIENTQIYRPKNTAFKTCTQTRFYDVGEFII